MNRTLFRVLLVSAAAFVGGGEVSLAADPPETSVVSATETRVFPLKFAMAKDVAIIVNQLLALRVVADDVSNSLSVCATPETLWRIAEITQANDKPPRPPQR